VHSRGCPTASLEAAREWRETYASCRVPANPMISAGKASKITTPPTITKIVAEKADFKVSLLAIRHLRDQVLEGQGKSPTGYIVHPQVLSNESARQTGSRSRKKVLGSNGPAGTRLRNYQNLSSAICAASSPAGQPDAQEHHAGAGIWNGAWTIYRHIVE
jgi:hypothetical protein